MQRHDERRTRILIFPNRTVERDLTSRGIVYNLRPSSSCEALSTACLYFEGSVPTLCDVRPSFGPPTLPPTRSLILVMRSLAVMPDFTDACPISCCTSNIELTSGTWQP